MCNVDERTDGLNLYHDKFICIISGEVSYTGWTLSTGFGSEFASRCSDVCTRWLLNTCLPTANPSPASLAVATCDRLTVAISISHVWDLLRTEDIHLHTPVLRIGTHFLLTLETVVFLFHLLSTTSKPFSSLSTRLARAARLVFFYKKTRYVNSLLLIACGLIGPEWAKNVALICSECDRSYFSAQFSTDCATWNMSVRF